MASKIQPEMYTQSPGAVAQLGNVEAIALLLQQALTVTQPQLLPTMTVQETIHQIVADTTRLPRVVTDCYDSQWTEGGVLIHRIETTSMVPWRKRSQPVSHFHCPPITRLLNRQTEVKTAIATLQAGGTMEFYGEPGIGKTFLLRALSHHPQLTLRFPGGMLYQRVYDCPLEDILQNVFEALYQPHLNERGFDSSVSTITTSTLAADDTPRLYKPALSQIQSLLGQQHICVVLDELSSGQGKLASLEIRSEIPILRAAVAPSNHPDGLFRGRQSALNGLPLQDAVVIFEEGLGRSLQPREGETVEQLCHLLEGYPRRLIQYAALVRHRQYRLSDLVLQLQSGMKPEEIVFQWLNGLPEVDRSIIALLATLGAISLHSLHLPALLNLGGPTDLIDTSLQGLLKYGVIETDGPYYYLSNNLVSVIQSNWQLEPWVTQYIVYFKTWLTQLEPPSTPFNPEAVSPIVKHQDVLFAVLCQVLQRQQWADVLAMGAVMESGFWLAQQWGRWRQILLLQWQAARSSHNHAVEARLLHQLGSRALCLNNHDVAYRCLTQALHFRHQLDDLQGAALTQHNLALIEWSEQLSEQLSEQSFERPSEQPFEQFGASFDSFGSSGASKSSDPPFAQDISTPGMDNSATLRPWNWFTWGKMGVLAGAIALLGLALFLFRQQSPEYGLRPRYSFPPQQLKLSSEPHFFPITNTSSVPLSIAVDFNEGDRSDFVLQGNDCTSELLDPGEKCAIAATFIPQAEGAREAVFAVMLGQSSPPTSLVLRGVGALVTASLQPNALTFGQQFVAERSQPRTITFQNKGAVSFMVGQSVLQKNTDNAFFLETDTCSQRSLQPRDSCRLSFSFLPSSAKNYEAEVNILDQTGDKRWELSLSGTGIKPRTTYVPVPTPVPSLSLTPSPTPASSPAPPPSPRPNPGFEEPPLAVAVSEIRPGAIAFGGLTSDGQSLRTVRVFSTGTKPLAVNTVKVSDTSIFQITSDTCSGETIAVGNECVVAIEFSPPEAGRYSAILTITDTSVASPHTISLRGMVEELSVAKLPKINAFSAQPSIDLAPADQTELCYNISEASDAYIVDSITGERIFLDSEPTGCMVQFPDETTTYTLVALNREDQQVTRQVTVSVVNPELDLTPPLIPTVIAPVGAHPLYCTGAVVLEWQGVTDDRGPVNYLVSLQQQEEASAATPDVTPPWTTVLTQTIDETSLNVAGSLQPFFAYRWQVQSVDAVGNTSASTGWNQFWCITP